MYLSNNNKPINKWFNIDGDSFTAYDISVQYTIDTTINIYGKMAQTSYPTNIDITISIEATNYNKTYFFDLYDKRMTSMRASECKFDIHANDFVANGCIIKYISYDPNSNSLVMDIISDYSSVRSLQDRRDDIIDQILGDES